jgi:hypothetical protein
MEKQEQQKLQKLIDEGYLVELVNPYAPRFTDKYRFWQNREDVRRYLKVAIVGETGHVAGLQG